MVRLRRPDLPPGIRAVLKDRHGRTVVLSEKGWAHIRTSHREMDAWEEALKSAVESADIFEQGKRPGVELLWARNLGPARWLVVVVAYDEHKPGRILTAYASTRPPRSEEGRRR